MLLFLVNKKRWICTEDKSIATAIASGVTTTDFVIEELGVISKSGVSIKAADSINLPVSSSSLSNVLPVPTKQHTL